jgi:hypothetical protein
MADVIQQHGLVRYPIECACGENFRRSQDWGRHVAEAIYEALEAAGVKRKRRTPSSRDARRSAMTDEVADRCVDCSRQLQP